MQLIKRKSVAAGLLVSLLILLTCANQQSQESNLQVTLYGAAEKVSGSMTLVTSGNFDLLIDAGLYYPEGEGSYNERSEVADRLNATIPINASDIDAVALTHAHLDHIGRLPLLISEGFIGDLFLTNGTYKLLNVMLDMQIRYDDLPRKWVYSINSVRTNSENEQYVRAHWNHCQWQQRIAVRNMREYRGKRSESMEHIGIDLSPCQECAQNALRELLSKINIVQLGYGEEYSLDAYKTIRLLDAAHIPGAASVYVTFKNNRGSEKRLLFSGDIGKTRNVLQHGLTPAPPADLIWIENTYGGVVGDTDLVAEIAEFQTHLAESLRDGGVAWIPAFALDRTQQVLYLIQDAKQKNIIGKDTPVFTPSPSAALITNLYIAELENKSGWFKDEVYDLEYPFAYHHRRMPETIPESSIIITTSGMMESVFSSSLLNELLPETSTTVFTVGYQDPDTPGGQLRSDRDEILWDGESISVNAKHLSFSLFSGHADALELEYWLSNQNRTDARIFLMHGELELLELQKSRFKQEGYKNVEIPIYGQTFEIDF